ncbi:hypothetical protein BN10_1200009 [Phycicoccus elongatus Lp2]|uniref:Uncharacterized protein n=1 Tax=Phycicoccus elongatus Lp2 TaxID=1193181 RepID=N0DZK9_9MICO|nr:hypothetical protein BN10_1200009 [Phycicoccus elongatus Lp2]
MAGWVAQLQTLAREVCRAPGFTTGGTDEPRPSWWREADWSSHAAYVMIGRLRCGDVPK